MRGKTSTVKTTRPWRKTLKKIPEVGKTSHLHGLTELISWKWLYYQKQEEWGKTLTIKQERKEEITE
jgi:hypothetical protein